VRQGDGTFGAKEDCQQFNNSTTGTKVQRKLVNKSISQQLAPAPAGNFQPGGEYSIYLSERIFLKYNILMEGAKLNGV
jgi:hypothetical protein